MNLVKEFPELFLELLECVAYDAYGPIRVHRHYSGRAMYGDECLGVTINRDITQVELGAKLMKKAMDIPNRPPRFIDDLLNALENARTDSMGLGTIVYFPGVSDPRPIRQEVPAADHICSDSCRKYVGDIAAPGIGQSYRCSVTGRAWLKLRGEFYDPTTLDPSELELSIGDVI